MKVFARTRAQSRRASEPAASQSQPGAARSVWLRGAWHDARRQTLVDLLRRAGL